MSGLRLNWIIAGVMAIGTAVAAVGTAGSGKVVEVVAIGFMLWCLLSIPIGCIRLRKPASMASIVLGLATGATGSVFLLTAPFSLPTGTAFRVALARLAGSPVLSTKQAGPWRDIATAALIVGLVCMFAEAALIIWDGFGGKRVS